MGAADDRWFCADECAAYFGMRTRKGDISRRGFLEQVACLPGFPRPLMIGNKKKWRLSELEFWAEQRRRVNRAA